jgi:hypothetical protein
VVGLALAILISNFFGNDGDARWAPEFIGGGKIGLISAAINVILGPKESLIIAHGIGKNTPGQSVLQLVQRQLTKISGDIEIKPGISVQLAYNL